MRLAIVQSNVVYGDPAANTTRLVAELERLSTKGIDLAVFPEAFLTGYCSGTREEARRIAIPLAYAGSGDENWQRIKSAVERTGVGVVVGYAGESGGIVVNAATMWLPGHDPMTYRKCHLPFLGMDRFCAPGGYLPIFETPWGKIGILICYDLRIPEPMRVLALQGAELVLVPTNWPGTSQAADHYTIVRSSENKIFVAACDRVGTENGFSFIGLSGIYGPDGACLAKAGTEEETLVVDIDLAEARDKRNVYMPGEYELDLWGCRQPEMYGIIAKSL